MRTRARTRRHLPRRRRYVRILHRHRGIERAQERAQAFTEKARAIIAEFPASPYQRALKAVTDLVTDRDR